MSICLWKTCTSLSKNTFFDSPSAPILLLILFSIVHQSCGYPLKMSALLWREDVSDNVEKIRQGEGGGLALCGYPFQCSFHERAEGIYKSFCHHLILKCKEVNKK